MLERHFPRSIFHPDSSTSRLDPETLKRITQIEHRVRIRHLHCALMIPTRLHSFSIGETERTKDAPLKLPFTVQRKGGELKTSRSRSQGRCEGNNNLRRARPPDRQMHSLLFLNACHVCSSHFALTYSRSPRYSCVIRRRGAHSVHLGRSGEAIDSRLPRMVTSTVALDPAPGPQIYLPLNTKRGTSRAYPEQNGSFRSRESGPALNTKAHQLHPRPATTFHLNNADISAFYPSL